MPRMSFLMITYNQEQYIAAALQAALAQDFPNLEIVVCDDGSRDRTFAIASEIAAAYHGPFRIVLHQNPVNLGIGANFQKAYSLSTGDWLFMAAGDDISLPNRCRVIADGIAAFPQALAFGTNYQLIDGDGTVHGYFSPDYPVGLGAVICWHRSLFADFPPLGTEVRTEDIPLLTRVFFLGGTLVKLPDCTVQYRMDGHSFTGQGRNSALAVKQYQIKVYQAQMAGVRQRLADLEHRRSQGWKIPHEQALEARQTWELQGMEEDIQSYQACVDILQGTLLQKLKYLVTPNGKPLHRRFAQRLRWVLASFPLLRKLKQALTPQKPLTDFAWQQRVDRLPDGLQPVVVTAEYYLAHEKCDYYQAEDPESFSQHCKQLEAVDN